MRRIAAVLLAMWLVTSAGCTLPEACYHMFGKDHYSAGTMGERDSHFRDEIHRWEQYDGER